MEGHEKGAQHTVGNLPWKPVDCRRRTLLKLSNISSYDILSSSRQVARAGYYLSLPYVYIPSSDRVQSLSFESGIKRQGDCLDSRQVSPWKKGWSAFPFYLTRNQDWSWEVLIKPTQKGRTFIRSISKSPWVMRSPQHSRSGRSLNSPKPAHKTVSLC